MIIWQITGYKNSGKTTLITSLLPILKKKGFSVAVIKHDAHEFEVDRPGTDTYKARESGADAVAITSSTRTAVMEEREVPLDELILGFEKYDIILVEGFKFHLYPKLVLLRGTEDYDLLSQLKEIKAAVVPQEMEAAAGIDIAIHSESVAIFSRDNIQDMADFLVNSIESTK